MEVPMVFTILLHKNPKKALIWEHSLKRTSLFFWLGWWEFLFECSARYRTSERSDTEWKTRLKIHIYQYPCIILYVVTKEQGKFIYHELLEDEREETFKRRKSVNLNTRSPNKLTFWKITEKTFKEYRRNQTNVKLFIAMYQSWSVFSRFQDEFNFRMLTQCRKI